MIQRIQSLFILIAVGFGVSLFFVPLISFKPVDNIITQIYSILGNNETALIFKATGYAGANVWYLLLFLIVCIATMFVQLFMYNNRKKQMLIGRISICLWILWIILFALFVYVVHTNLKLIAELLVHFGALFPCLIIILILLANRNIKKDEELVRSMDRIR